MVGDPRFLKLVGVVTSRKFWTFVVTLGIALSIVDASESEVAQWVEAVLMVLGGAFYILGVATEDGLAAAARARIEALGKDE